mgnify:CR=1 FL=1
MSSYFGDLHGHYRSRKCEYEAELRESIRKVWNSSMNISARIYDELKFIARKREHAFNLYSIFLNVFESKVIKFD